jgi:uncharacterized protein YegP (UPF0339 family)/uncharacterized surface protein with fasciclin (FAS1) repeats
MEDIVDIAVEAGGFKTFVAAVKAVGLVEILQGQGPFTIFVPDDGAFKLLPEGTVDDLMKNIPKLKAVLMYHVIPGKFTIDEIAQMKTAKTVQGQEIKIHGSGRWHLHMNPIINDDAHITTTDIVAESGILHIVDRVLMPNMELTCPVCGMGFMTMEAMNAHTQTAHIVEKAPEPMPAAEVMPIIEKAPEPMATPEVMPTETKPAETMPVTQEMPAVEKAPEPMLTAGEIWGPLAATTKASVSVFEILLDSAGRFRFHLKANNGQIIAVSQSYGTKESAQKGIASIKKNAPIAKIADLAVEKPMLDSTHRAGIVQDPIFEIQCNAPDKFRFHLKAANGEIIAVSQSYGTKESAENGIASVKKNAPMAKIVDQTTAVT